MSTESESIFIDTNVLIYSTFSDFEPEKHIQSLESLNQLLQSGTPLFVDGPRLPPGPGRAAGALRVGRSKLENGDAFLEIIGEHCRKGTFTPVGAL